VNAAYAELEKLGLKNIDIVGIAKGRKLDASMKDRLYKPGQSEPILLGADSQALHILQQVRDEAHRFAIAFHQKMRRKRGLHSVLDDIPGVGRKRKKILLQHFRSMKRLRESSYEELLSVTGIDKKTATAVHRFFHVSEDRSI
jgi:excinuclease ABC subunit C